MRPDKMSTGVLHFTLFQSLTGFLQIRKSSLPISNEGLLLPILYVESMTRSWRSFARPDVFRSRLDALRHVVFRVLYQRADGVGRHVGRFKGTQHSRQHLLIMHGGIESEVVLVGRDDDRHSLLNRQHQIVSVGGENRAGPDGFALFIPAFP